MAKAGNCVVLNVDFMNAPEIKAPGSSLDCYAALKWIHEKADEYNVDRTKISSYGPSGGGFVSAVFAKILAEKDEGHLVKTVFLDVPQIMDVTVAGPYDDMVEPGNTTGIRAWTSKYGDFDLLRFIAEDWEKALREKDSNVFPLYMGDELFAKVPNHVILTKEFDMSRWGTELYARELMKNGKLLDINYMVGHSHMSFGFGSTCSAGWKFMT